MWAQIDHMVINRMNFVFLFETKCFNGNLKINEHGEFTMSYAGGKQFGIPSPLEQSRRHERILAKLLDTLEITRPYGQAHVCACSARAPQGHHHAPSPKTFNTDNVIKADAIETWHQKWANKDVGVTEVLNAFLNIRSQGHRARMGRQTRAPAPTRRPAGLARLHAPTRGARHHAPKHLCPPPSLRQLQPPSSRRHKMPPQAQMKPSSAN
jgi:hypothetical protein